MIIIITLKCILIDFLPLPVCNVSAEAVAAADPADVPGLFDAQAGPVHEPVLHHSGSVLQLHAGELCMPARGELDIQTRKKKEKRSLPVKIHTKCCLLFVCLSCLFSMVGI